MPTLTTFIQHNFGCPDTESLFTMLATQRTSKCGDELLEQGIVTLLQNMAN